jgi:hypothetical protein
MNKSKKYQVITVAKVGSASMYHSLKNSKKKVYHEHSLARFKNLLDTESNLFFIVGIRNPIDRNLSYFFQTYKDEFYNEVKTKKNNYKGEYCYNKDLLDCNDFKQFIKAFHNSKYLYTFNDWFNEFLNLTNLKEFDKDKGYQIYKLDNNNQLLVYTLESLNKNKKEICNLLEIEEIQDSNKTNNQYYKIVKDNIKYSKSYINNLLDTKIMKIFYNQNEIENFKLHATIDCYGS